MTDYDYDYDDYEDDDDDGFDEEAAIAAGLAPWKGWSSEQILSYYYEMDERIKVGDLTADERASFKRQRDAAWRGYQYSLC